MSFRKLLVANRGDQPRSGAAAKPNRLLREAQPGDLSARPAYV